MAVEYQELVPLGTPPVNRFEQDSDYDPSHPFWPAPQRYIDGRLIARSKITTKISTEPFPDSKGSRRELSRLFPNEKELIALARSQILCNPEPNYHAGTRPHMYNQDNGITPPYSDRSRSLNGEGLIQESVPEQASLLHHTNLPNGVPPIPNGIVMHDVDTLL